MSCIFVQCYCACTEVAYFLMGWDAGGVYVTDLQLIQTALGG